VQTIPALVLAAAGGLRLQQEWAQPNTLTLVQNDTVVATYGTVSRTASTLPAVNRVSDALVAPDGSVWVVDRGNGQLLRFDRSLTLVETISDVAGSPLISPSGIAALPDGRIVGTDSRRGVIIITPTATGTSRSTVIVPATSGRQGVAFVPREVVVSRSGEIIVHDRTNGSDRRLVALRPDGSQVGEPMSLPGIHTSLALSPAGDIVGFDSSTRTLTRIGADGSTSSHVVQRKGTELLLVPSGDASQMLSWANSRPEISANTGVSIQRLTVDRETGAVFLSTRDRTTDFQTNPLNGGETSSSTMTGN